MRILLVNSNQMKPAVAPIGLDYIADSIAAAGHDCRFLDLCFSNDIVSDITSTINNYSPDVIGMSIRNIDDCYFSGGNFFIPGISDMVAVIRNVTSLPIVLGGVGFSIAPIPVMEFTGADYGIVGEGEVAFLNLLDAIDNKSGFDNVPNLVYRENGCLKRNTSTNIDLNLLPERKRSFVNNAKYFSVGGQAGFETKRGCNMKCTFCADPVSKGRHVRLRDPGLVVNELRALLSQGIDHFHTCDCEFNIPGNHAKDVCREIINAGLGEKIRWYAYCSIIPFDSELADLMKSAGCAGIDFGADNGNDEMLRRLGRSFTSEDLIRTSEICRSYKISFMYDLLLGSPGETKKTVRETIDLVKRANVDCVGLSMGVRIFDNTVIADFVRAQGDISANPDIYGAKTDNPHFLKPVFYIVPELGDRIVDYVRGIVGDDKRFFLPSNEDEESNYNYNDNNVLVNAIANGARGAYWDILRRL